MPSSSDIATRGGLRIANVAHRYGDVTALGPVDLDVEPGAFLVLVGASGGIFALILWLTTMSPQSRMLLLPLSARNLGLGLLIASGALAVATPWLPAGSLPVSHSCHFGGALAGWLFARRAMRSPVTLADLQKARARRESRADS